ncbi:MAG: NAD(P)/FAD-dependent oxidoreductase [Phycisphaerales bacterium JB039]
MKRPSPPSPHIVVIGAGFAGLACARALRQAPVRLTLIDRRNHHLFQPLLYQVATAALSPADIAAPIRAALRDQRNVRILMAEVTGIDVQARRIDAGATTIDYDILVVATGATHSYFGHDDWERHAPGLKTVGDAVRIRSRFLRCFEAAAQTADPARRRAMLTTVVIGAGPTGVEMAGAMIEIAHESLLRDFPEIARDELRVILLEGSGRVLPGFPDRASRSALRDLRQMGVDVQLDTLATAIDADGVDIRRNDTTDRIDSRNVIWAAGVKASPLGGMLGAATDRGGRIIVQPDLTLPDHREVFVLGDLACVRDPDSGAEVPGLAPGAMQLGRYCAGVIAREATGRAAPSDRPPFRYRDKGMLATIGRGRAVAAMYGRVFAGRLAWLLWAGVHIFYLIGFRNRVMVMLEWAWQYVTWHRGARLITGDDD